MSQRLGGRFVLGERIGSGGMSTVYLGVDEVLERSVAIKVLKPEHVGSEVGARFRREGRTAARLSHPNIVQVYDAGEGELEGREVSYIVMEHVSGGDLKQRIRESGPLSGKTLSGIGADVAAGLAHAHERGVIHRDVKPQNVLLDEYGQPKLADFGIARALDSTQATQATQTGAYLGTATYSSPEQLQGGEVTSKSDIYSLGITLYEAATGSPPFSGTPVEVIGQQLSGVLEPPREKGASIGPEMEARIMECLAKEPGGRPVTSELRERLLRAGVPASSASNLAGDVETTRADALSGALISMRDAGARGLERRTARSMGAAALRTRLKPSPDTTDGRPPVGGITFPNRTFGARPNRTALLAVAAGTLLVIVIAVSLVAALGSGSGGQGGAPAAPAAATTTSTTETAPDAREGSSQAQASSPQDLSGNGSSAGRLTDVAAAETVAELYLALTRQRYARSYELLSAEYRESEYPSLESWTADQGDLRALRFLDTPEAKASDGEAEVKGEAEVIWSDGTVTRDKGTWNLVQEDDGWKVDEIKAGKRLQGPSQQADEDAGEDDDKGNDEGGD